MLRNIAQRMQPYATRRVSCFDNKSTLYTYVRTCTCLTDTRQSRPSTGASKLPTFLRTHAPSTKLFSRLRLITLLSCLLSSSLSQRHGDVSVESDFQPSLSPSSPSVYLELLKFSLVVVSRWHAIVVLFIKLFLLSSLIPSFVNDERSPLYISVSRQKHSVLLKSFRPSNPRHDSK